MLAWRLESFAVSFRMNCRKKDTKNETENGKGIKCKFIAKKQAELFLTIRSSVQELEKES